MKLQLFLLLLFLGIPAFSGAQEIERKLFGAYDTALVIINRSSGAVTNVNPVLSARRLSPCSTFKIYNTLIALQLGLLKGADEPWYSWDGVHRDIEAWNRNLTLREAFRVSAVPAFQALAREIGPERMKTCIERIGYGNSNISSGIDTFWLPRQGKAGLLISADEQVALLNKLLDGKLPFSEEHLQTLRDIMLVTETAKGRLYGKTGSGYGADGKEELGWFVGFLESGGVVSLFACNITGGDHPSGKAARAIVEQVFASWNLL
jgi:beta-lactamase class D